MELPPSHLPAARAAAVAVGYLRYLRGGPGRGLQLRELRRARRQDIDDVGHKYYLELELEDVLDKDRTVHCTAEVLHHLGSKSTAPDVQVAVQGELRSTEEADQEFYTRIRSLEKELVAENIPDSHGNVPPELEPIHLLAWAASGYVTWHNSTENTNFHLAQVKHVRQVELPVPSEIHQGIFVITTENQTTFSEVGESPNPSLFILPFQKRPDEDLQFDYVLLLHEMVSQEVMPWEVTVLWHPRSGVRVPRDRCQPCHALGST